MKGPPPPKLAERARDIPRRFAALIDRCMERDLNRRFQSWDEVIATLDAAMPRPIVPAPSTPRVLSWLVDLAVFAAVARGTLQQWPLLSFAALAVWVIAGAAVLGATPGQWVMRLMLRRPPDLRVPFSRVLLRFAAQHGWLAFGALAVALVYQKESVETYLYALFAAALFLVGVGGSVLHLFTRERRTLVDLLSGTRVLVDVRGGS
jgi:hypothetical protein